MSPPGGARRVTHGATEASCHPGGGTESDGFCHPRGRTVEGIGTALAHKDIGLQLYCLFGIFSCLGTVLCKSNCFETRRVIIRLYTIFSALPVCEYLRQARQTTLGESGVTKPAECTVDVGS